MKKLLIPLALLSLSALLAACGGGGRGDPTPPPSSKFSLTAKVTGVASAPVKIINTSSKVPVFEGTLTGSKTFGNLAAGNVLSVQGGAVSGFATPAAQNVTLNSDQSVTLAYTAAAQVGAVWSNTRIAGAVTGTDLQLNSAYMGSINDPFFGKTTLTKNVVAFDISSLVPGPQDLLNNYFGANCTGNNSDPSAQIYGYTRLRTYSPQGDLLGEILEKVVAGPDAALPQAVLNRVYSTRAFTFRGVCTFKDSAGGTLTDTYDFSVVRGWNTLVASQSGATGSTRNAAAEDRIELVFISATPEVAVNLDPTSLNFGDKDTVTVNADVIQVGNSSGKVNLSTTLAGLTVEPSTLTLNPLPKLSLQAASGHSAHFAAPDLQPQMLKTKLTFKYSGNDNLNFQPFSLLIKDTGGKQVGRSNGTLSVSRPGIRLSVYPSEIELAPSSTANLSADLYGENNFNGKVILNVSGLPSGVTASPVTANLSGYANAQITLTSSASVKGGTYPLTVTAQGGGKSATAKVNLVVPKPGVTVALEYSAFALAQGEKAEIGVTVQSTNGFSGPTTLQLSGLPGGVTGSPVKVTVTPNTITTVKLLLSASASATVGEAKVQVTSPDLDAKQPSYGSTLALTVRPARTALGANVAPQITPGKRGVWTNTLAYNTSIYNYTSTLKHVVDGKVTATAAIKTEINTMYTLSDGSVIAYRSFDAETYLVTDTGIKVIGSRPKGLGGDSTYTSNAAADSQGQLWFTQDNSTGAASDLNLVVWNPITNAVKTYPASDKLTLYGSYTPSNDGKSLLYQSFNSISYKINTATGDIKELSARVSVPAGYAALKNDGLIYFTDSYQNQLKRLNLDGTITGFLEFNTLNGIIGFDRTNDQYLWVTLQNGVAKIDLSANTMTRINLDSINAKVLLSDGGIGVLTSEPGSGGSGEQRYLTVVR